MNLRENNKKIIMWVLGLLLLLGGCMNIKDAKNKDGDDKHEAAFGGKNKKEEYSKNFVSIQDYKGEGYTLRNSGTETDRIAEKNSDKIEKAVKSYFLDKYKTEVKVHNIVGAVNGASVFVESMGEPHFYSFAIVPIDIDQKEVKTDKVWSQEGQVEFAIKGSLYAMIFDEEFSKLDTYLESVANEHPIVGTPMEAIEKVGGKGFTTEYYYISTPGPEFDEIYNMYLENPNISKEELKKVLSKSDFKADNVVVTIYLYMKEKNTEPDQVLFNQVVSDIESMEGLPKGEYSVLLNDNLIDRRRAIGDKDNSLERSYPNKIIKD